MLTKSHFSKYPFVTEAANYLREKDLTVNSLSDPTYERFLVRAEERLKEAISTALVSAEEGDLREIDVETFSFPIAALLAAVLQDDRVARRYALAESKRASHLLENEDSEILLQIASNTVGWDIHTDREVSKAGTTFWLNFTNYIKNAIKIRDSKWKLINRLLYKGYVQLTKEDAARLLEEEIQTRILRRIGESNVQEPEFLREKVDRIRAFATERMGKIYSEEAPGAMVSAAMPPCVRKLYEELSSGKSISHISRFTLTSFLVNVGATQDDILRIYRNASDFDEGKTKYQVEHIAGSRGGKTKYTPPKCATLKTHGLCVSSDGLCAEVRHPLTFYRRKLRSMLKGVR